MANSADPDQLASSDLDLHCLQRQGISGFSRTRVNNQKLPYLFLLYGEIIMAYIALDKRVIKINEPAHDKSYNKTCVTSKDSDQPV